MSKPWFRPIVANTRTVASPEGSTFIIIIIIFFFCLFLRGPGCRDAKRAFSGPARACESLSPLMLDSGWLDKRHKRIETFPWFTLNSNRLIESWHSSPRWCGSWAYWLEMLKLANWRSTCTLRGHFLSQIPKPLGFPKGHFTEIFVESWEWTTAPSFI